MKKFETPVVEVLNLMVADVITASTGKEPTTETDPDEF